MKSLSRLIILIALLLVITNITGCLSTEYKEYIFNIGPDGSGNGEVIFYNIISVEDDEKDVSFKDFGILISDYIEGMNFEKDHPNYNITNKELFEKDSMLIGKVEFTFDNFRDIGFFKSEDCECSKLMYYMGDFGETYSESNGNYLGDEKNFPVIIWESEENQIYIKTIVQDDLANSHSLLKLYYTWNDAK